MRRAQIALLILNELAGALLTVFAPVGVVAAIYLLMGCAR